MLSWLALTNMVRADNEWIGTTGSWSTGSNWSTGVAPSVDAGALIFGNTATQTNITCDTAVSGISGMTVTATGYFKDYWINGTGSLTFNDGASVVAGSTFRSDLYFLTTITAEGDLTFNVPNGSLSINNALTLNNNKSLIFNSKANVLGAIGGSGSLVVNSGSGTVHLYSANTYSGSTTINSGTLQVHENMGLPETTNVTIASGGTLLAHGAQRIVSLSGAGNLTLTNSTWGFADLKVQNSTDTTFSGAIGTVSTGDTATFTKRGTGTLTLNGTVNNVAMQLDSGALVFNGTMSNKLMNVVLGTLYGVGTVYNLDNGFVVSPGGLDGSVGTLTVTHNYRSLIFASDVIHIDSAGEYSKIAVGGTASLEGSTVDVRGLNRPCHTGTPYTFLTAGTRTGAYAGITDDLPFMDAVLSYTPTSARFTFVYAGNLADAAVTPNQRSVAAYLDRQKGTASGDFQTVLDTLCSTTADVVRPALDTMTGELHSGLATINLENTENFLTGVARRLRQQGMARGMTFDTARARWNDSLREVSLFGSDLRTTVTCWNPWIEGFGMTGSLAGDGNASGLSYYTGGVSLGLERWLDDDLLLGFAGSYNDTYTLIDNRTDHGKIDTGNFAVYLERRFDTRYLTAIAGYGYNGYDTFRHVIIDDSLLRTAEASYGGNSFSFYTEAGQNFRTRYVDLQPYAALEYIQSHQNGFTETGADAAGLSVGGMGADALRGLVGGRILGYIFGYGGDLVTVEARAAWRHEFLSEDRILDANFAGQTGTAFPITGASVDREVAIIGCGLTYDVNRSLRFRGNFDSLTSNNYTAYAGSGNIEFTW